jgi:glycosyltransferase involved in cell wall biosynthesis
MTHPSPTVSACLLTYRRASVLPRTIQDILAQSFQDYELVINDDRSPDDTESVCRGFAEHEPRIRYFRNERNLRYAGNQNAAVARSRGKYVAFLHDGDRYSPRLLEQWVAALEANPSAALVFNAVNVLSPSGEVTGGFDHGYPSLMSGLDMYDEMLRGLGSPIFGIVMVRRDALLDAGAFDETMPVLADVDMWFRLLRHHDVAYVQERLYSIYPREADHLNRAFNWSVREEFSRIYRLACDRRFMPRSSEWRRARRKVDLNLTRHDITSLASCVKHRRMQSAVHGVVHAVRRLKESAIAQLARPK